MKEISILVQDGLGKGQQVSVTPVCHHTVYVWFGRLVCRGKGGEVRYFMTLSLQSLLEFLGVAGHATTRWQVRARKKGNSHGTHTLGGKNENRIRRMSEMSMSNLARFTSGCV